MNFVFFTLFIKNSCPAPNPPDPHTGTYTTRNFSDYEQQILGVNRIRNTVIDATRRVICYNQAIYDDIRLEMTEYVGLTLAVRTATIITEVKSIYDQVAIQIMDEDGKQ